MVKLVYTPHKNCGAIKKVLGHEDTVDNGCYEDLSLEYWVPELGPEAILLPGDALVIENDGRMYIEPACATQIP